MRLRVVPVQTGGQSGLGQHGLTIGQPSQTDGVKGTEKMKGVIFNARPLFCCLDKGQVKRGIVPHKNGTPALSGLYSRAHRPENSAQGFFLGNRAAQRLKWINTSECQCCRVKHSPGKGPDMKVVRGYRP